MGAPGPTGPGRGPRPADRDLVGVELADFAGALAHAEDRWRHLVRHTPERRVYELVWADDHVTAWVICWSAGHDTGFHDHGASAGAIHVVRGIVCEERLSVGRLSGGPGPGGEVCGPGMSLSVPACAIHRVFHGGGEPAVSLHAYSPPLTQMGDYSWGPDGRLEREPRACALPATSAAWCAAASGAGSPLAPDGATPPPGVGARAPTGRPGRPSRRSAPAVTA